MLDEQVTFPDSQDFPVAGLSSLRSAAVDLELGLSLSAKFLIALGVPVPGADVTASLWQGASSFTFEVSDVVEHQVDVAHLGRSLQGRRIERTPATEVFFTGDGTELFLITRTLTTNSFAIRGTSAKGQSVKVAVDAIPDLLGEARATVSWKAQREDSVAFTGPAPVTFAFAAVPCAIDAQGGITFGLTSNDLTFGEAKVAANAQSAPIIDEAGLVDFDEATTV